MYIRRQLWNFRVGDPKFSHKKAHKTQNNFCALCASLWQQFLERLLTLAVAAVTAEIAAARVLELAVAFGADADHAGHDGARHGLLGMML